MTDPGDPGDATDLAAMAKPDSNNKLTLREFGVFVAQLAGMCTFALAGPLLVVLQDGGAFLVAQRLTGVAVVVFVVAWIVVPALVPIVVVGVLGLISASLARRAMAVLFGVIIALGVLGLVPGMTRWRALVFVAAWIVLGVALYLAYLRWSGLRQFATALVLAPLVFGVGFLVTEQISSVAFASEADPVVPSGDDTPVVFVVFDEFMLGAMLTPTGQINADLFPNFARLADTSTWYPRVTGVAPFTVNAMPSLLSGQLADMARPPSAAAWPNTLFTAVGRPGKVTAFEFSTAMCPAAYCPRRGVDVAAVGRDSAVILANRVLPAGLASRLVPPVADSWMSFGQADDPASLADVSIQEFVDRWLDGLDEEVPVFNARAIAAMYGAQLAELSRGDLAYLHLLLPHGPFVFLPDGTSYNGGARSLWMDSTRLLMGSDPYGQVVERQRTVMQSMYADVVLGQVLDQLEASGMADEALVVVTSDHGVSIEPGGHRRSAGVTVTQNEVDDVLAVPLFIKYPGQSVGVIDDRDARLIDVMPTVADVLNIDLDPDVWYFDGTSLLADPIEGRPRWFGDLADVGFEPSAMMAASRMWVILGERAMTGDLFAIGPHADLLGRPIGVVQRGSAAGASLTLDDPGLVADVDLSRTFRPALVTGNVGGVASGTWLAASVNGTIAGLGVVFAGYDGGLLFELMLQPDYLVDGANELELHIVDPDSGTLRKLTAPT